MVILNSKMLDLNTDQILKQFCMIYHSKLIKEKNPKEIEDPAEIMVIKPNHIKINDEDYYKISSNPKDISKYK